MGEEEVTRETPIAYAEVHKSSSKDGVGWKCSYTGKTVKEVLDNLAELKAGVEAQAR